MTTKTAVFGRAAECKHLEWCLAHVRAQEALAITITDKLTTGNFQARDYTWPTHSGMNVLLRLFHSGPDLSA